MGPPGVPRVPILGPNRGIFSKLNGPGPLGSGGDSHTSFSNGRFRVAQRTLQYDVVIVTVPDERVYLMLLAALLPVTCLCRVGWLYWRMSLVDGSTKCM